MSAALVVPAEDAGLWIRRLIRYAVEHELEVAAIVVVEDEATARHDIMALFAAGEVNEVLAAFVEHVPPAWPTTIASEASPHLPMQRRPHIIDRGGPRR